jgi:hypothetical protein
MSGVPPHSSSEEQHAKAGDVEGYLQCTTSNNLAALPLAVASAGSVGLALLTWAEQQQQVHHQEQQQRTTEADTEQQLWSTGVRSMEGEIEISDAWHALQVILQVSAWSCGGASSHSLGASTPAGPRSRRGSFGSTLAPAALPIVNQPPASPSHSCVQPVTSLSHQVYESAAAAPTTTMIHSAIISSSINVSPACSTSVLQPHGQKAVHPLPPPLPAVSSEALLVSASPELHSILLAGLQQEVREHYTLTYTLMGV